MSVLHTECRFDTILLRCLLINAQIHIFRLCIWFLHRFHLYISNFPPRHTSYASEFNHVQSGHANFYYFTRMSTIIFGPRILRKNKFEITRHHIISPYAHTYHLLIYGSCIAFSSLAFSQSKQQQQKTSTQTPHRCCNWIINRFIPYLAWNQSRQTCSQLNACI